MQKTKDNFRKPLLSSKRQICYKLGPNAWCFPSPVLSSCYVMIFSSSGTSYPGLSWLRPTASGLHSDLVRLTAPPHSHPLDSIIITPGLSSEGKSDCGPFRSSLPIREEKIQAGTLACPCSPPRPPPWAFCSWHTHHCCCWSVTKLCPTLRDSTACSTPGFSVPHHLLEFVQVHVYWTSDAIQPSHPLPPSFSFAFNLFQLQGLFQWVSSLHQVSKVLELQH